MFSICRTLCQIWQLYLNASGKQYNSGYSTGTGSPLFQSIVKLSVFLIDFAFKLILNLICQRATKLEAVHTWRRKDSEEVWIF